MSPSIEGLLVLVVTLLMLVSGIQVAFGLGAIALTFLVIFQGFNGLNVVAETFWSGLDEFTLVAIPMFVMMGAAIGSSPAGKDLYEALDRWLYRVPGGLAISNIGACAIFAALTGSSPACCAAIGKMGIPEMRRRGYPDEVATGSICAGGTLGILIPPSITFILYGIATETSIGRLFIAGVMPGIMLTAMFMLWTLYKIWRSGFRSHAPGFRYSWSEKFASIPKIAPFLMIVIGVMYALYGGIATPSEAAGVGAALCLILAIGIYRLWRPDQIWHILRDTMRESVMILTIIATAVLFGYMLTSLYLTQTLAQAIADLHANRWVLMFLINIFLLVCGFFIPPAAIILMTSPILLPIITAAGFDPVWFGVILTINMEIGLIHPPVGLNIYIVSAIAPDVPLSKVMWGTLPYVGCMMLAIVILCIFPEIATWLPDKLMGDPCTSNRCSVTISERQRLGLLDLRQRLYLGEHVRRHGAIDLDQRDGVAALLGAAEMEGRDVDLGIAEQAGEVADETRLVLVGDVDHRLAELGVDADALDVDQPRLAVVIDGAGDRALLPLGRHRHGDQALIVALRRAGHDLVDHHAALLGDDRRGDDVDVAQHRPQQARQHRRGQRLGLHFGDVALIGDLHLRECRSR